MNSRHQLPAYAAFTILLVVSGTISIFLIQLIDTVNFKLAADAERNAEVISNITN